VDNQDQAVVVDNLAPQVVLEIAVQAVRLVQADNLDQAVVAE
jgi:hypothetical protein